MSRKNYKTKNKVKKPFKEKMSDFLYSIKDGFIDFGRKLRKFFTRNVPDFFESVWEHIKDFFESVWNHIVDFFKYDLPDFFSNLFKKKTKTKYKTKTRYKSSYKVNYKSTYRYRSSSSFLDKLGDFFKAIGKCIISPFKWIYKSIRDGGSGVVFIGLGVMLIFLGLSISGWIEYLGFEIRPWWDDAPWNFNLMKWCASTLESLELRSFWEFLLMLLLAVVFIPCIILDIIITFILGFILYLIPVIIINIIQMIIIYVVPALIPIGLFIFSIMNDRGKVLNILVSVGTLVIAVLYFIFLTQLLAY